MSNIDLEVLSDLTDDDIKTLYKNTDINIVLEPIKHDGKHYAKYTAQLGRMDKNSVLVQRNLPRITFELYKKGDANYLKLFAMTASNFKNVFASMLKECMGEEFEPEQVNYFTIENYRQLLKKIISSPGTSLDLQLFFLQTKMYRLNIDDDMKRQIEYEWNQIQEIENVKKELKDKYEEKLQQKLNEVRDEMKIQNEIYNGKIGELEKKNEELNDDVTSKQDTIVMLMSDGENERREIKENQKLISEKEKVIVSLKEQIEKLEIRLDEASRKLQERRKEEYNKLDLMWQKENSKKVNENKEMERKLFEYHKQLLELEEKKKQQEYIVSEWENHIESYFSNMDQRIIEHRIESILYKKGYGNNAYAQVAATTEYSPNIGMLYVQKGYKVKKLENCMDYEDYVDVVEANMTNIGDRGTIGTIYDCFNAAIDSGLCPLICGYGAREYAMALLASRYAESPEIISVPAGYWNTRELVEAINMADISSVIVEDVFGRMNEGVILPILRDVTDKIIVFTVESIEDLKHLQKHYYNYLQLIVTDKRSNIKTKSYLYADANKLFTRNLYTGKESGHKLARNIFEYIGMDYSYVITRGNVLCELLSNKENNSEEVALIKLISSELKWLLKEEKKEKLIEFFETNKQKYSKKLIECIG